MPEDPIRRTEADPIATPRATGCEAYGLRSPGTLGAGATVTPPWTVAVALTVTPVGGGAAGTGVGAGAGATEDAAATGGDGAL